METIEALNEKGILKDLNKAIKLAIQDEPIEDVIEEVIDGTYDIIYREIFDDPDLTLVFLDESKEIFMRMLAISIVGDVVTGESEEKDMKHIYKNIKKEGK